MSFENVSNHDSNKSTISNPAVDNRLPVLTKDSPDMKHVMSEEKQISNSNFSSNYTISNEKADTTSDNLFRMTSSKSNEYLSQNDLGYKETDSTKRFQLLCYEQVLRLNEVMQESIPVHGRGNFPTLEIRLAEMIKILIQKLRNEEGIKLRDVRLNGSAASYVVGLNADIEYNDLDLIFGVDLASHNGLQQIKTIVMDSLTSFLPNGTDIQSIGTVRMRDAYVQKLFKVWNNTDRWSLISLMNRRGRNVELKFVDRMRRQFEFSVDSFQILLDSLITYYELNRTHTLNSTSDPDVDDNKENEIAGAAGDALKEQLQNKFKTSKYKTGALDDKYDDPFNDTGQYKDDDDSVFGTEDKNGSTKSILMISSETSPQGKSLLNKTPRLSFSDPCLNICSMENIVDKDQHLKNKKSFDNKKKQAAAPTRNTFPSNRSYQSLFKAVMSEDFYPTVIAESVCGNFAEAYRHLCNRIIFTRKPEEIRGGGLLKYCHLLTRGFTPAKSITVPVLEKYMCSRFFIDFPEISDQQRKIDRYLATHLTGREIDMRPDFLMNLYRVVDQSTVCLMSTERSYILDSIYSLALAYDETRNRSPNASFAQLSSPLAYHNDWHAVNRASSATSLLPSHENYYDDFLSQPSEATRRPTWLSSQSRNFSSEMKSRGNNRYNRNNSNSSFSFNRNMRSNFINRPQSLYINHNNNNSNRSRNRFGKKMYKKSSNTAQRRNSCKANSSGNREPEPLSPKTIFRNKQLAAPIFSPRNKNLVINSTSQPNLGPTTSTPSPNSVLFDINSTKMVIESIVYGQCGSFKHNLGMMHKNTGDDENYSSLSNVPSATKSLNAVLVDSTEHSTISNGFPIPTQQISSPNIASLFEPITQNKMEINHNQPSDKSVNNMSIFDSNDGSYHGNFTLENDEPFPQNNVNLDDSFTNLALVQHDKEVTAAKAYHDQRSDVALKSSQHYASNRGGRVSSPSSLSDHGLANSTISGYHSDLSSPSTISSPGKGVENVRSEDGNLHKHSCSTSPLDPSCQNFSNSSCSKSSSKSSTKSSISIAGPPNSASTLMPSKRSSIPSKIYVEPISGCSYLIIPLQNYFVYVSDGEHNQQANNYQHVNTCQKNVQPMVLLGVSPELVQ